MQQRLKLCVDGVACWAARAGVVSVDAYTSCGVGSSHKGFCEYFETGL